MSIGYVSNFPSFWICWGQTLFLGWSARAKKLDCNCVFKSLVPDSWESNLHTTWAGWKGSYCVSSERFRCVWPCWWINGNGNKLCFMLKKINFGRPKQQQQHGAPFVVLCVWLYNSNFAFCIISTQFGLNRKIQRQMGGGSGWLSYCSKVSQTDNECFRTKGGGHFTTSPEPHTAWQMVWSGSWDPLMTFDAVDWTHVLFVLNSTEIHHKILPTASHRMHSSIQLPGRENFALRNLACHR